MSAETAADHDLGDVRGNSYAGDVWVNFKRWTRKGVRNPFIVAGAIIQPIIFLVLFTQVFGGVVSGAIGEGTGTAISYETFLVPAIAIQVSLVAAASSGIGLVNDIEEGMFEKVLVSPMNRSAVFLGKSLAEFLRIAAQILIVLVLGWVLGAQYATGILGAIGVIAIGVVFSLWFTAFTNIVALLTRDQESTIIGANLLQFPLLFVSSAFLPLTALPDWIQTVAMFNPITYGADAARALVLGQDVMTVLEVDAFGGMWNTLVPAIAILLGIGILFGAVAVWMLNRASQTAVA